jgi:phosphomannomutase
LCFASKGHIIDAIYGFFQKSLGKTSSLTIVLGRDMRVSSPSLFDIARDTLTKLGASVIDVGLVSTPTFYFSVFHYNYDCGIQITASHNPKEYNGIKFVENSPNGLIKIGKSTGMETIKQMVQENYSGTPQPGGGVSSRPKVLSEEVENALNLFHNPKLAKYKIVADPANAMGATYIQEIFQKVPAELIKMNFELDGTFPAHQPDPLDFNNLVGLQERVLAEHADFGLAPDGDGDRLFFIDEKGAVVPASAITAIIAKEFLRDNTGALILFDIRYILTPQTVVKEAGGRSEITKVGHAFITEQMGNTGALFAGESSAHYFYKASGNAESQVVTIITVLKALTESGKTLSQLVEGVSRSFESGEINFTVTNAPDILEKLKEKYKDGELSTLDGIAISYPTWRFSVRTSNTEPLLRLNLESVTKEEMETRRDELVHFLKANS